MSDLEWVFFFFVSLCLARTCFFVTDSLAPSCGEAATPQLNCDLWLKKNIKKTWSPVVDMFVSTPACVSEEWELLFLSVYTVRGITDRNPLVDTRL